MNTITLDEDHGGFELTYRELSSERVDDIEELLYFISGEQLSLPMGREVSKQLSDILTYDEGDVTRLKEMSVEEQEQRFGKSISEKDHPEDKLQYMVEYVAENMTMGQQLDCLRKIVEQER